MESTTVYISVKQFCLERSDRSKVQKSSLVDHRYQNASEKHVPSVDLTFSLCELETECIQRLPIQIVQCIVFD